MIGAKPLRTRFNKIDGFIRVYNETTYLILFGPKKYDAIYNRIKYLMSQKKGGGGIIYVSSHYYVKIKVDSYDCSPLKKIVCNKVRNKDQNQYYYNKFLEKRCYQLAKK